MPSVVLGLSVLLFPGRFGLAQCESQSLQGSRIDIGDLFGSSVDLDGTRLVAGAAGGGGIAACSGVVYLFQLETDQWVEDSILFASDGAFGDLFGLSTGISGDVVVVGAPEDDDNGIRSGAIYVYRFDPQLSEWVETKLLPEDNLAGDQFGISVDISGGVLVAGAWFDDNQNGGDAGSAYVFRYDGVNWVQEVKLLASDGEPLDWFGRAVAISGSAIVVGAQRENESGDFAGAAYVFRYQRGQWVQEAKLLGSQAQPGDTFGYSVDIDGDDVIVGAVQGFVPGEPGAAYMFSFDGHKWTETARVEPPDENVQIVFGYSVAIDDGVAAVGAPYDFDNGPNSGSAFVYEWSGLTWPEIARFVPSDNAAEDLFGNAVAVASDLVAVGAWYQAGAGAASGKVYVFDLGAVDCDGDGLCDASGPGCPCPQDIDFDGMVGITDLLAVLLSWGTDPGGPPDFDGSGAVGITDLLALLGAWGPCS